MAVDVSRVSDKLSHQTEFTSESLPNKACSRQAASHRDWARTQHWMDQMDFHSLPSGHHSCGTWLEPYLARFLGVTGRIQRYSKALQLTWHILHPGMHYQYHQISTTKYINTSKYIPKYIYIYLSIIHLIIWGRSQRLAAPGPEPMKRLTKPIASTRPKSQDTPFPAWTENILVLQSLSCWDMQHVPSLCWYSWYSFLLLVCNHRGDGMNTHTHVWVRQPSPLFWHPNPKAKTQVDTQQCGSHSFKSLYTRAFKGWLMDTP